MVEDAAIKQQRLCSEILLEEWGTSGRIRPRLSTLYNLLRQSEMIRAADYILENLLKGVTPPLFGNLQVLGHHGYINEPTAPPLSSESLYEDTVVNNCQGTTIFCHEDVRDVCEVKMFSYHELYEGTSGFSESLKLGEGGFGVVYLCTLPSGDKIAVKKLNHSSAIPGLSGRQFRNELLTVTQFSHKNLLQLIGYSSNGPDLCFAYVYMENGSLEENLKPGKNCLDWKKRYKIACGTAEGIVHLHTFTEKPMVHRDIKSANILLDQHYIPKVGDFGLVRHGSNAKSTKTVALTSTVLGTSAYMAPEAFRGDISVKMDVFSFGVVLLELITGLPPFDSDREGCDLATHVDEADEWETLIDVRPGEKNKTIVQPLFDIAQKCLLEKKARPNMTNTLKMLQEIYNYLED
ncbi:interleukin-1 receptor-associated kinase 4-like isoform X2 [Cimex lectularius]|nr:interleukin-1 receptor-associated kinase 4-like isoform X2 [Cimex lectularius]